MRPLRTLSWGLLLAMIALAAATYGDLPDRIPVHLGFSGQADRWASKSFVQWFLPCGIAVVTLTLLDVIGSLMPKRPDLLNIPDKEQLLRLPRRYQSPVMVEAQRMMDATAVGVMALILMVQWMMVRAATGARGGLGLAPHFVPFALVITLLLFVTRISSALDAAVKRWKQDGSPAE